MLKYNDSCVATLDSNQIERIIHVHYIFKITTCTCRYMTVEGGGSNMIWETVFQKTIRSNNSNSNIAG